MRAIVNHIGFEFKSVIRDKTLLLWRIIIIYTCSIFIYMGP